MLYSLKNELTLSVILNNCKVKNTISTKYIWFPTQAHSLLLIPAETRKQEHDQVNVPSNVKVVWVSN